LDVRLKEFCSIGPLNIHWTVSLAMPPLFSIFLSILWCVSYPCSICMWSLDVHPAISPAVPTVSSIFLNILYCISMYGLLIQQSHPLLWQSLLHFSLSSATSAILFYWMYGLLMCIQQYHLL
jgi:hypothetical protein